MTLGTTLEETQRLQKEELHKKIDAMAETMYGITDAKNYKDYILGLMFYRYLCEREETVVYERYKASLAELYPYDRQQLLEHYVQFGKPFELHGRRSDNYSDDWEYLYGESPEENEDS